MSKLKLTLLITGITMAILISGCAEEVEEGDGLLHEVAVIESMEDLFDGGYYVRHEDKYYIPYFGERSFEDSSTVVTTVDPTRVLWFTTDFDAIPTLYEGDTLVFCSTVEFPEHFTLERFEDIGYTIGISNLKKRESGRYTLNTNPSTYTYINAKSDAAKLFELGDQNVTIETIGNNPLRSGNVTNGGTIRGLSKDKTYKAEIYTGTILQKYDLKADARAMLSFEVHDLVDYEFLRSDIIEIEIPDNIMTGYYSIEGSGLFRYVKGDHFDENTDFNEPTPEETDPAFVPELDESLQEEQDVLAGTEVVYVEKESQYSISIETEQSGEFQDKPKAYLVGNNETETMHYDEYASRLYFEGRLPAGTYLIQIYNIDEGYAWSSVDLDAEKRVAEEEEAALKEDTESEPAEEEITFEAIQEEASSNE